jgi:hypothetical protein
MVIVLWGSQGLKFSFFVYPFYAVCCLSIVEENHIHVICFGGSVTASVSVSAVFLSYLFW